MSELKEKVKNQRTGYEQLWPDHGSAYEHGLWNGYRLAIEELRERAKVVDVTRHSPMAYPLVTEDPAAILDDANYLESILESP